MDMNTMYGGSKPTPKPIVPLLIKKKKVKRTKAKEGDKRVIRGQSIKKIMEDEKCTFGDASKKCSEYYNKNGQYY